MDEEPRARYALGQLQAVMAMLYAVIETHPDKKLLRDTTDAFMEAVLAKLISESVTPEAAIAGFHDMRERLQNTLRRAADRHQP